MQSYITDPNNPNYDPPVYLPPDLQVHEGAQVFSEETWHLPRNIFREVRKHTTGKGIRVAVLDTGINPHPSIPKPLVSKSFINGQTPLDPTSGHGTHCAGTIASRDEDIGLAPEADLFAIKVLSNQGSGSSSGIADGIEYAIEQGAHVISMSLGGGSSFTRTNTAIRNALNQGIIVCIAAGNSGFNGTTNTIGWPARSAEGICVAALTDRGVPANFSSGGMQMTIAAPGQNILSCDNRGPGWRFMSGTSMATPFVAGCWALLLSLFRSKGIPSLVGINAVNEFIKLNATDLLKEGHDPATGHGMFSMLEVVTKVAKDELVYA